MNIPQDYHTHTSFSCDGHDSPEKMVREAAQKKIPELGISEHFDNHPREVCTGKFIFERWWVAFEQASQTGAGLGVSLKAGVEAGEPHRFASQLRALLDRGPFDYVLGSLHWIGDETPFERTFFRGRTQREVFKIYFDEMATMLDQADIDILGHLDLPNRASHYHYGTYDPALLEDLIRPILDKVIRRGIALDINTSALRKPAQVLSPGERILRWYREMGGERITLGSDAHYAHHVGAGLEAALSAAQNAGFTHLTQFTRRQPVLVPIS